MRKQILLISGLLLAHQAGAVTIINTDSQATGKPAVNQPFVTPAEGGSDSASERAERQRGAPPLPSMKPNTSTAQSDEDQEGAGRRAPPIPDDTFEWIKSGDAESNAVATGLESSQEKPDEKPDNAVSETKGSSESGGSKADDEPALAKYVVEKGWLSDAIDKLAYKAGYEMMWDIGRDEKADFEIHREFTLDATTARDALSQIVEPFPVRLCLFEMDKIAKVVAESSQCQ